MALVVDVHKKDAGTVTVTLSGSLDSTTYTQLQDKLKDILNQPLTALAFNMQGLSYISSMGVSVVLNAKKIAEQKDAAFILTNLKPQIRAVFDIIKALPDVCVFENMEEADRYLTEMQKRAVQDQEENA